MELPRRATAAGPRPAHPPGAPGQAAPAGRLRERGAILLAAVIAYVLLIVYGSLFPFSAWKGGGASPLAFLAAGLPARYSSSDLFVNVSAYVPLGLLLFLALHRLMPARPATRAAFGGGIALSLAMEATQTYLPARVPSLGDLLANAAGTALGLGAARLLVSRAGPGAVLHRWREGLLRPGGQAEVAFGAACLGMFVLLGPVLPSLDGRERVAEVLPPWRAFLDVAGVGVWPVLGYAGMALGLMVLAARPLRPELPRLRLVLALVAAMALLKFCVTVLYLGVPSRQWLLSGKAALGLALAAAVFAAVLGRSGRLQAWLGGIALAAAYVVAQLEPGRVASPGAGAAFNWIPFRGQMSAGAGVLDVLAGATLFFVLGCLACAATPAVRRRTVLRCGAVAVFVLAFVTEWWQRTIPGRHPDLTDVLLAVAAWSAAWLWAPAAVRAAASADASPRPWMLPWPALAAAPVLLAVALVIGGMNASTRPLALRVHAAALQLHPTAAELPPVNLPGFRHAHPRLPAPTASEVALIRAHQPAFFEQKRRAAKGGAGDLEAAILMAYIEPGSQDLDLIFRRLTETRLRQRGAGAETIALGYDWLHDFWDETQRQVLCDRLSEAFDFTYRVIRDGRLSPYNVYFYNSPFQRLVALAVVLYGDDERGEGAMRVVHHLLKEEVLPVWRQVMGRNGGWHEGGEYVGIGIGQAVYRVPAMWRQATGEDLFASEPHLRGFLDFLIQRTRPDGLHFRWGDGGHFDRDSPDRHALALEFRHAVAYAWGGAPRPYTPASWPWGPLADPALAEAGATPDGQPLSRLFDGIGLVVARSDWSADASYVTFKAGDNYWSHSHLDQGAFTIYKGGELAIDSGLYGPRYGSSHHMNYSYQTIAHNTITVTDPADTATITDRRGEERRFANDGGQRRIGSGWGVEPAPLNLAEWLARRDTYHTGRIVAYREEAGLTIAVADITPAYTNAESGRGTFSHRTRRVERAWRVFAYDRIDEVVVVQDQVVASDRNFRKRWLLHTQEEPVIHGSDFFVQLPPSGGRAGGRLHGRVLYPADPALVTVGGPGFEFYVDGVNYDEGGEVKAKGRRNAEPGSWRIELMPEGSREEDRFLVVMLPTLGRAQPAHRVTRLEAEGRFGCEVAGPRRTSRWWFEPGRNGVSVEVETDEGRTSLQVGEVRAASDR